MGMAAFTGKDNHAFELAKSRSATASITGHSTALHPCRHHCDSPWSSQGHRGQSKLHKKPFEFCLPC